MDAMPRPRPPYLHRFRTRHDKYIWYVRRGAKGKRVRIHAPYDTEAFWQAYRAALEAPEAVSHRDEGKVSAGTMAWLWERYREVGAWTTLSPPTRRARENIMKGALKTIGDKPIKAINQASVEASVEKRLATPYQARHFLDTLRGMFRWAKKAKHVTVDPTAGVVNPTKPKGGQGFPMWTEEDIEAYYRRWPLGTRERVWIDALLYTGLRRGDAVVVGRQHLSGGLRTEKSGEVMVVQIIILPTLQTTLDAGPTGDLTFICNEFGRPFTKESFGNAFSKAARAAGVRKSAHGLRKAGATRAADNGASEHELMAIFGWRDPKMAQLYTRNANRKRLAQNAMAKVERTAEEQISCPPILKVGTPERKL